MTYKAVRASIVRKNGSKDEFEFGRERIRIQMLPGALVINEADSMSPTAPMFTRFVINLDELASVTVTDVEDGA